MRILHVVHHFPPELFGGTQEYVASLARAQLAGGHAVRVFAGTQLGEGASDQPHSSVDAGVDVVRFPRQTPGEALAGEIGAPRLEALILGAAAEFAPDLVHVHHWSSLTRHLVRGFQGAGLPVVVTLHDLYVTCARHFRMPDSRRFCSPATTLAECAACVQRDVPDVGLAELEHALGERNATYRYELELADRVLCISVAQREYLEKVDGFSHADLHVLPFGLPRDFGVAPARPDWTPVEERLRIVNWAGLDPRKGIHVLLEAIRSTYDPQAFEVHLHGRRGDAVYMDELMRLAEGLDVHFHGPFEDEELAGFAPDADVAVFPFLAFETHGIVVDEALRLGLPVIVPDHGAPKERLHGKGFAIGIDVKGLASTLEWLVDQPEELERMRSLPHRLTSLEEHVAALDGVYAEVQAGRQAEA